MEGREFRSFSDYRKDPTGPILLRRRDRIKAMAISSLFAHAKIMCEAAFKGVCNSTEEATERAIKWGSSSCLFFLILHTLFKRDGGTHWTGMDPGLKRSEDEGRKLICATNLSP